MLDEHVAGMATPAALPPVRSRLDAAVEVGDRLLDALRRSWADPLVRRGMVGMTLVAAGAVSPAFLPPGAFDPRVRGIVTRLGLGWLDSGLGRVVTTVLLAVGMALLVDAWLRMRPVHGRRPPSLAWLLWSLPVLFAPPLFSRDAYSYAAQGEIVARGIDPYTFGPFWVPGPFSEQVDPMWVWTPAPYGPLALQVQHAVVALAPDNAYAAAVLMRLPALAAVAVLAYALPRLAERYGASGRQALWLGVLNPLVVMHFIGGAHGDAVMVALVVLGLLVASRGRLLAATVVVAAAATYKQTAVLALVGVVGMAVQAHGLAPGPRARALALLRQGLVHGAVFAVAFSAITALTGLGWGWIPNLSVPVSLRSLIAPSTFVGSAVEWVMRLGGLPESAAATPVPVAQTVGLLVGLVAMAVVAWRHVVRAPVHATAAVLLLLCVCGPVVHPWYLLWGGVVLAATRLGERAVHAMVVVTLFFVTYGVVDATVSNGTWALGVSAALWMLHRWRTHRRASGAPAEAARVVPDSLAATTR